MTPNCVKGHIVRNVQQNPEQLKASMWSIDQRVNNVPNIPRTQDELSRRQKCAHTHDHTKCHCKHTHIKFHPDINTHAFMLLLLYFLKNSLVIQLICLVLLGKLYVT